MHYVAGDPALFINEQGAWQSHPEDRKYLCQFHPCNEISIRFSELVETGKKQDPIYVEISEGKKQRAS